MESNIKAQMRKGIVEYCVLSLLAQGTSYSSEILEAMKQAQLIVVEGTLYPLVMRLKNGGYLTYVWQESNAGPPRKYYSLTPTGHQLLDALRRQWQELSASVDLIANRPAGQAAKTITNPTPVNPYPSES